MRIGAILSKAYWKTKFTMQTLKKRWEAKVFYEKLLRDSQKRSYENINWNCLIIDWRFDGMAVDYLSNVLKNEEEFQTSSIVIRSYDHIMGYTVEVVQEHKRTEYVIALYRDLESFLKRLCIKKVFVNEVFGYDSLYELLNLVTELKEQKEYELFYLAHDSYCFCPITPWEIKTAGHCVLQNDCNQCLKENNYCEDSGLHCDLCEWRERWGIFLKKCDVIITFSMDIKENILKVYRNLSADTFKVLSGSTEKSEHDKYGVSICIPAYNNAEYVKRLLHSIKMQTYHNYEVIITDDSSDQEVEQTVVEYVGSMPVRYYRNHSQLGPTRNNNRALSLAEGKYIKIMHHDDWFARPDSLEQLIFLLEANQKADLAFSGDVGFGQGKGSYEHIKREQAEQLEKDWRNLFFGNWVGAPSVTIFRNKGWLFDENLVWCVDYELYMRILSENPKFVYTELPLVCLGTSDIQLTKICRKDKQLMHNERRYVYQKFGFNKKFRFWLNYIKETIKYNQELAD